MGLNTEKISTKTTNNYKLKTGHKLGVDQAPVSKLSYAQGFKHRDKFDFQGLASITISRIKTKTMLVSLLNEGQAEFLSV